MAIPHVYSNVLNSDFTMNPTKVHKTFTIQRSQLYSGSLPITSSGYKVLDARYPTGVLKLETDSQALYETNSFDGSYKSIVWKSIDAQYYRHPYDPYKTLEHANPRFTYKFLNYSASIISIPYMDHGESIKPGSVELTSSAFSIYLKDDGNGNLYDTSDSGYEIADRENLIAYWGFNSEFRRYRNTINGIIEKGTYNYVSHIFEPDEPSTIRNLSYVNGVSIFQDFTPRSSGLSANFLSSSIITHNRDEFNFSDSDDFTISMWIYPINPSMVDFPRNTAILSKNTMIRKQVYGKEDKYNQNDLLINTKFVSSSIEYNPTNVYPYRIEFDYYDQKVRFSRSDGINLVTYTTDYLNMNDWNSFVVTKQGNVIVFYLNGNILSGVLDTTKNPVNKHSIVFGKDNIYDNDSSNFRGYLDEIRIYNKSLSSQEIGSLSNKYDSRDVYQTDVVGNVFYKGGNVVLSSPDPKYQFLSSDWTLKFKSTHVIYSYECLVRIPAGSFNLSQNPSTLKNPYEDLIIDEMTGSLSEGALFPYATAIGLYNDKRELMAIAKLSQPLQMRDDVDISISIKFDS